MFRNMGDKMLKKRIYLFVVLCLCLLCGCGSKKGGVSPEELAKVCNTWQKVNGDMTTIYTIKSDGTYTEQVYTTGDFPVNSNSSGTYTYDGKTIKFESNDGMSYSFDVSFDGDDMILEHEGYQNRYSRK
ncbi:MAG: hypothetical protein HDT40_00610 [Lachnospiraceae bacterium]|nr:hypothetical protein [Lachnospiraceae bacterium]